MPALIAAVPGSTERAAERRGTSARGCTRRALRAKTGGSRSTLARRSQRLALGAAVLQPFGRLFRYWHAVHMPLAVVMALVLLVHIAVAFLFGYAWT